jgi:hypothetical protein
MSYPTVGFHGLRKVDVPQQWVLHGIRKVDVRAKTRTYPTVGFARLEKG